MQKTIWVTGGGSGIGRSYALKMTGLGHRVYISGRDAEKLARVGHGTIPLPCDVADIEAVQYAVQKIEGLDLALLNAGTYDPAPVVETPMDNFHHAMDVNYFGTLHCLKAVMAKMTAQGGGQIGVVASVAGYRGLPNASGYGPSKAAVISLCESLRSEMQGGAIKFQVINPGFVRSPLTDKNDFKMPHLMDPDDAAQAIIDGMAKEDFEIAFPKPFVRQMKFLRMLPYKAYFPLIRKVTKRS